MRLTRIPFNKLASLINSYSNYNPSPMSLQKLADFGKNIHHAQQEEFKHIEIKSYEFLKEELLVRLAQMSKEMLYLPDKLIQTSSVQMVYSWYLKSFEEMLNFKEKKPNDLELKNFTKNLNNIVQRHSDVVQNMAMGILQVQETYGIDNKTEQKIQYFLDRFLMSRISIRMLINQHVLMFNDKKPDKSQIGAIDPECDVLSVLQDAYNNAKFLCDQYYLCSPDIVYTPINMVDSPPQAASASSASSPNNNGKNTASTIKLVYVPSHLYHIAFELYKNAMRAVIETHGTAAKQYPKIETLIVKGPEDLTIRITDYGGGIPKSKVPLVFKYMYSTAPKPAIESDAYSSQGSAPLAGYGYGLPLSRLYARYFNGDLQICSVDGHSTDAYIYLKTLSKDANELLPIHNKTSEYNYKKTAREPNNDWT